MGASMALAGLAGCTKQPEEPIYPYVKAPEDLILGRPVYFASAFPFATGAVPLLIKTDAFRPIKVDGNPTTPTIRAAPTPSRRARCSICTIPTARSMSTIAAKRRQWAGFLASFRAMLADKKATGGQGLYFLSNTVTSPTMAAQWKKGQAQLSKREMDPVRPGQSRFGLCRLQGCVWRLCRRAVPACGRRLIVSLDADFLSGIAHPGFHRLAKDYATAASSTSRPPATTP